ncbi:uncharacterized protein LOC113859830 [Abrus precatorius]|uniref:Uncharacterized protein LOC113859830 n=1 Tax=Abrus precatorius TaxID=3816 RepID=A0A8B8KWR5_ABRPR|nr:uncharacterized protein LOC113859830 [Abrus precatorius]
MKQKFQGSTRVKRAQLQALSIDFEVLRMNEGETVNSYFARTLKIAKSMKVRGECMRENVIIAKILRSMISKFNYVMCSIEESNNLDVMTIDELKSSLLVREQRMNCHEEEEHVLQITNKDRGGRGKGRREDFSRGGRGRGRGRQRQFLNKAKIECFNWQKRVNYAEMKDEVKEEDELLLMSMLISNKVRRKMNGFLTQGAATI